MGHVFKTPTIQYYIALPKYFLCRRGPKTCREGGNVDLRVNKAHEHLDLHVIKGAQDVPRDGNEPLEDTNERFE